MKVVLDTNVLISALLFKGKLGQIFDLIEDGTILPCFTPETLQELEEVITRKKFAKLLEKENLFAEEIIEGLIEKSLIFPNTPLPINIEIDDLDDLKFIACALVADAKFIVSGDDHLLKLRAIFEISIISPNYFLKIYNKSIF